MSHIKGADERAIAKLVKKYGVTNVAAEAHEQAGKRVLHNPRRSHRPVLTRESAWAASLDAANRHMRKAGRTKWNEDDYNVAWREFDRLWPEEHGLENPVKRGGRGKFVHVRVRSPRRFVSRSLRTVRTDGGRVVVGHLKGEQRRTRKGRTRQVVQAILRPRGGKRTLKRGNPPLAILGNPPNGAPKGTFMGKVSYIEYRHDYDHEPYYHHFRPAAYMFVKQDGSVVLYHPQNALCKFFEVK